MRLNLLSACCARQVRDQFFALVDNMFKRLCERSQDPGDQLTGFYWNSLSDVPPSQLFNMDEMGSDTNKSRKKKAARKESATDLRKRAQLFEETWGDNNPFHVTVCLTTCANGTTCTPPFLIHSNPNCTTQQPRLTKKCVQPAHAHTCSSYSATTTNRT